MTSTQVPSICSSAESAASGFFFPWSKNPKLTKDNSIPYGTGVRVRWFDSQYQDGWRYGDPDTLGGVAKIESLGYVVTSNRDDGIVLTTSLIARKGGGALNPFTIPWGCIEALEHLESQ